MSWGEALVALFGLLVLSAAWFGGAWASPTTRHVGLQGDPDLFLWFLRWVPFAIGHGMNPLITHAVNYPQGVNLMWNTSMPLLALALSPITVTAGPVVAYNLALTLGPALSGWFAYLAFRRWAGAWPALAGSLVFAFGPFVATQAEGHPDKTFLASAPLLLVLFDRLLVRQDAPAWRIGLWLGLVVAAQLLISEEVLVIEFVAAAVGAAALALSRPELVRRRASYVASGLVVAVVVSVVIAAWPLATQFLGPRRVTLPVQPPGFYVADLAGFVVPTSVLHFSPPSAYSVVRHFPGGGGEWVAYLGVPLLVLLGAAAVVVRRRVALIAFAVGGVAALFSLGPRLNVGGHETSVYLPWRLVENLPVMRDLLPSRYSIIVALMAGLLVALFLETVGRGPLWVRLSGWALAAVSLLALLPRVPYASSVTDAPIAFQDQRVCHATGQPKPTVAVLPVTSQSVQLWQEQADFCFNNPGSALLGGYAWHFGSYVLAAFGPSPSLPLVQGSQDVNAGLPPPPVTPAFRLAVADELAHPRVDAIVVGPMNNQGRLVDWLTAVTGSAPRVIGGTYIWTLIHR